MDDAISYSFEYNTYQGALSKSICVLRGLCVQELNQQQQLMPSGAASPTRISFLTLTLGELLQCMLQLLPLLLLLQMLLTELFWLAFSLLHLH